MPRLKNVQHEAFCQFVVNGLSQTEAYQKAYDRTDCGDYERAAASRLIAKDNIALRIDEIRELSAAKFDVTREGLADEFAKDRDLARSLGQISAAIKATEHIGKLFGVYVEKSESTTILKDARDLNDDELADIARRGRNRASETQRSPTQSDQVH